MSHIESNQRQPASSVAIDRDLSRVEQYQLETNLSKEKWSQTNIN
tara:strand:- start:673 stop:807 length:135 start_codon:yes stop_codon:yes gene_type:complete